MSQEGIIDIIGTHPEIPIDFIANVGSAVPIANTLELLGEVVIAGTNPFRSIGSGNTITYQVQIAQAIASTNATNIGLAAFNSSQFSVDANGFVTLLGGGEAIDSIAVQTGTSPIVPTVAGLVTINGAVVAAGTNPVRSHGTGANTMALEVQISQAIAATDATKIGLSNFNSAHFSVDANGFVSLTGGGQAIDSFSTDVSGPISPDVSGNVAFTGATNIFSDGSIANTMRLNLQGTNHALFIGRGANTASAQLSVGTNGQLLIAATGADPSFATVGTNANMNTVVGANALTLNPYNCAKWIVDPNANIGTHQTITAALAAASSGDTIFVRPGTYTENLTLKAGVDICSFICDALTPNVTIIGNSTLSTAGIVSISGIRLQTNSAALLTVSGSAISIVNLNNCYLNCTNSTGIIFSTSGVGSRIRLLNCLGDLGTTGISYFTNTAADFGGGLESLLIRNCKFTNTGNSTTANNTSASITLVQNSMIESPLTTSSTGGINIHASIVSCGNINTTSITTAGTSGSTISLSQLLSGTASAISVGAGTSVALYESVINSSNTNAISGSGILTYSEISFVGSSSGVNTTTLTAVAVGVGSLKFLTATGTTGTATSSSLNFYEEGTWVPTLTGGTTAGSTTYSLQNGYYTKIGNIVFVAATVSVSAATGTGNAVFGSLPFTVKNQTNGTFRGSIIINAAGWAWPASTTTATVVFTINNTTATVSCYGNAVAASSLQMTNAAATFTFSGYYQV